MWLVLRGSPGGVAKSNARTSFAQQMWVESVRIVAESRTRIFLGCAGAFDTGYLVWDTGLWDTGRWGA